jgi:hypothetical protein
MSDARRSRVLIVVLVLVVAGVGVLWLGSGRLLHWLMALHGQH